MVKHINVAFNESDFEALQDRKGEQSWEQAILDWSGVSEGQEADN